MPYHLSFDMNEQEWMRIATAARQTWQDEKLSGAEIIRRCVILGVRTLPYLSPESARQFVSIYRNYQPPFDGNDHAPSTTPGEAEGDPL